jgi:Alpha-L-arabinofuranosidase
MTKYQKLFLSTALALSAAMSAALAANPVLTVQTDRPGAKVNPAMWGLFFEDINLGADGGLYAELVKNRSFEFPDPMMGWTKRSGAAEILTEQPFDSDNPHYLRISAAASGEGVANEGFRGMGLRAGEDYNFTAQVRAVSNAPAIRIELTDENGIVIASARIKKPGSKWSEEKVVLRPKVTVAKGGMNVLLEGPGVVDFDMVSLFPKKTWKNRKNGMRADMVQLLADMKPGFLRFPGGCIVEGSDLDKRYQWKTTIGPIQDRKLIINRWNSEFKHRLTPDYFQSFGLGFFEFFQLSEDIGAEPLPILNCGMACQFNTGQLVPLAELDPYIQDALDLIEFANGPVTSTWGAKRAAMGHPKPFNMKMLGIGNEQWGPQYLERYEAFAKVLKEKHPEIQLVSAAGPSPADDRFNFLFPRLNEMKADIIDEHCYGNPIWFLANANRFDTYDRNGPKIFMGEYAAQSVATVSPENKNNLECALSEAAYMTGMERNADVVTMASYAPLFAHIDGWQWTPNLIWTDNLRVQPTPNYYVQKLFSVNRGDVVLPVELSDVVVETKPVGAVGIGTYNTAAEFKDVSVTANGSALLNADFSKGTDGWTTTQGRWEVKNGTYVQSDERTTSLALAGKLDWQNYTISLKARKISGAEGFMVTVRHVDSENYIVWNIGGYGNKFHTLQRRLGQQPHLISQTEGSIESGRWYDVKVELNGARVDCYLDGRLVQSAEIQPVKTQTIYASATRDQKAREVILKVVNPGAIAIPLNVNLANADVKGSARVTVLTGNDGSEVNTLDEPNRISPKDQTLKVGGAQFVYETPARSLSVIRVPVR